MKINCFSTDIQLSTPQKGLNDYFKFHIYACNYIGFAFHIMGYGITAHVCIHKPSMHHKSDSNSKCE